MKLKFFALTAVLAVSAGASANFTYVGSFLVAGDGAGLPYGQSPLYWMNSPTTYSGLEAAALLYGGSPTDYAISTVSDQVADINHKAWMDGYADTQFLLTPADEDFKTLGTYVPGAFSAYVVDNAWNWNEDVPDEQYRNYVFRTDAVPEPASMAALGFGALALLRRRKKA